MAKTAARTSIPLERPPGARRLADFKQGCHYGGFGTSKAYELIAAGKIKAYKMGFRTKLDLDSVDEFLGSLSEVKLRSKPR